MRKQFAFLLFLQTILLVGCDFGGLKPSSVSQQNRNWSTSTLSSLKTGMTGYMASSLLGNHQAISIDTDKKELVLSLPAPNLFQNWVRPIKELSGASLTASVNSIEQSFLTLRYPIYLLISQFDNFGGKSGLPNGQNIPGVPGGKLHSLKIVLDKYHQSHIFFDKGVVGLLLDVPYDPMLATSIPIKKSLFDSTPGNILGYANTIPKDNNEFGGLLLSTTIPISTLQMLEQE